MTRLEDDLRSTMHRRAADVGADRLPDEVARRAHIGRARTIGLVGVLTVCVVLLGVGILRAVLPHPAPPEPTPAPQLPLVQRVPVEPRANGDLVYPADGRLVRRAPDGTATTWLTHAALVQACGHRSCAVERLAWSPDGSRLALVMGVVRLDSPSKLSVHVLDDGSDIPRKLFDCPASLCASVEPPAISWSPDGTAVAVGSGPGGEGIAVLPVDTDAGGPRMVCRSCAGGAVSWSPDGRWIAYSNAEGIFRTSPQGGPSEPVSTSGAASLVWSPEGTRLLADSEEAVRVIDLARRPYDEDTLVRPAPGEGPSVPAWAPDGGRVSWFSTPGPRRRQYHAEVWTADSDGSHATRLRKDPCCVSWWSPPTWSPDGRLIALGLSNDAKLPPDLLVLDAVDGSEQDRDGSAGWGPLAWQGVP